MRNCAETDRVLIRALINMSGKSDAHTARECGFPPQNLSSWLNGTRPSALSEEKRLALLNHLGVRYNSLKLDVSHQWLISDPEPLLQIVTLLDLSVIDLKKSGDLSYSLSAVSPAGKIIKVEIKRPLSAEPLQNLTKKMFERRFNE